MKYLSLVLGLLVSGAAVATDGTITQGYPDETLSADQYEGCNISSSDIYAYPVEGLPTARQLESMSSTYGWSGSTSTLDVTDHVLKTVGTVTKTIKEPFYEDWGTLAIPVCHDYFTPSNQNGGTITISNGTHSVNISGIYYQGGYHTVNGMGWRFISSQNLIDAGFSNGDQLTIKIKNSSAAPYSSYTGWGKLLKMAQGVPTIVLTFDDGGKGPWDQLAYTQAKGIKGTIFYPWEYEGRRDKLTVDQLRDLKDAGWDIELNGTGNDGSMTNRKSAKEATQHLVSGRQWLAENGLNDYARFFAYPNGNYDKYVRPVTKKGVQGAIGSPVVEMSSVSGIKVGMVAEARTFPKGTRVVSVDSENNTVTLDNASLDVGRGGETVTKPNSYMSFFDDSGEFYTGKLQAELKKEGFKVGRTTRPNTIYSRYCVGDYGLVAPARGSTIKSGDDPVARVESWIEDPQKAGTTTLIYLHNVTGSQDGINTSVATYQMWIDKLAQARDEGKIQILTMQEWYERDCGDKS